MSQLHNELKKEFQLERLILFSDAVFAIAITLLVIEIKIPEVHDHISDHALLQGLAHLIPKFIGFLVSFLIIGLYWTVHHRMFGFVIAYTRRLLWLNLFFLFFIALMPFATGFYSEYAGPELFREQLKVPMTFYVLNIAGAGFFNYIMWLHISNPKNKLIDPHTDMVTVRLARLRSIIVPCTFLLMLPVAWLFHPALAVWVPMLIPVVMKLVARGIRKKAKPVVVHETLPEPVEKDS